MKNLSGILSLFWTNRKAARTEGCAPFFIKKIITKDSTYTPEPGKLLKLSQEILDDILDDMDAGKPVDFELNIGNEILQAQIKDDFFSVSAKKNSEIEDEIIEKLEELKREHPNFCQTFIPRVMPHKPA
ncbi:MAG: hypothetical protein FJ150_06115 [Euryarchaeota archaeon]|nr:hypothetical protein [Euryarchaeota archaeon]